VPTGPLPHVGIVHIMFLIGFRNRILVLLQWAWSYITWHRGARLITGPWKVDARAGSPVHAADPERHDR